MPLLFGVKRLDKLDDWIEVVGKKNWVPRHSAYELAHKWHGCRGLPASLSGVLRNSGVASLAGVKAEVCYVEKPVLLDTGRAPSMTDIMVYARNAKKEPVILGVEGKALEPFGARLFSWARGDKELKRPQGAPRRSRVRRLEFLAKHLGISSDPDSAIRYQLLHRTVSVVLESELYGTPAGLVAVQSFCEEGENWDDFCAFLSTLNLKKVNKNVLTGPACLGVGRNLPVYFLWLAEPCSGKRPNCN
jgi:hypothetical protein